ncbi:hypothetical protein ADIMK_3765 [Marinobacterium lacunae]|uniref:General secretion pathway protein N n=1 Tax=Marinobacterium lacunae TaxID=1232683 RepID=A0A081FU99_9GAMM|nr:hypothetical protein [Marinobacterium lacunae]KEA62104.1 hypothetical protein ADIMK_3765 [Marinobacterium lacunae]
MRLPLYLLLLTSLAVGAQEAIPEPMPADQAEAPPPVAPPLGEDGLPQMPPKDSFDEIIQRPLFSVNRRPMEPVVGDSSESALRETWKLTGVVLVEQQPQALFAERTGERKLRLGSGMPLDQSWLVESIQPLSVTLTNGEQSVTMDVFEPRALPPPEPEQSEAESNEEAQPPASIESRTQRAAEQLRERVEALKGGLQ